MITVKTENETKEFEDRETAVKWILDVFPGEIVSRSEIIGDWGEMTRDCTVFSQIGDELIEIARLYDPADSKKLDRWN